MKADVREQKHFHSTNCSVQFPHSGYSGLFCVGKVSIPFLHLLVPVNQCWSPLKSHTCISLPHEGFKVGRGRLVGGFLSH